MDEPRKDEGREHDPRVPAAHSKVGWAKRTGRLVPQPCEVCGEPNTDAHHDDYDKPLEVRWLCRSHHLQLHGKRDRPVEPRVTLAARFPRALADHIRGIAAADRRTPSSVIRLTLEMALEGMEPGDDFMEALADRLRPARPEERSIFDPEAQ